MSNHAISNDTEIEDEAQVSSEEQSQVGASEESADAASASFETRVEGDNELGPSSPEPSVVDEAGVHDSADEMASQVDSNTASANSDGGADAVVTSIYRATTSGWFAIESDGVVHGWCVDRAHRERRLNVELLVDGHVVGHAKADRPHARLTEMGEGDGHYAFAYLIPPELRDGAIHTVEVNIVTDGYEGAHLKTRAGDFSIDSSEPFARVILERVTADVIEGVLTDASRVKAADLDLWVDGVRTQDTEVSLEWVAQSGENRPFRLRLTSQSPLEIVSKKVVVCYPGTQESMPETNLLESLLQLQAVSTGDGQFEIRVGPSVRLPEGFALSALLKDEGQETHFAKTGAIFHQNVAFLALDDDTRDVVTVELVTPAGDRFGAATRLALSNRERLVRNGAFQTWSGTAPMHWSVGDIALDRSFYAFPNAFRNQYQISCKTVVASHELSAESVLVLSQPLRRTSFLGLEPVDLTFGVIARASGPIELELRLIDEAGQILLASTFAIGVRWKHAQQMLNFQRNFGLPSQLTLQVLARSLEPSDRVYVELAGIRCGSEDIVFDDFAEQRTYLAPRADGENLVVNSDLLVWPNGLAFGDRRSRFEIAEGWFLFNRRANSAATVAALPSPAAVGNGRPRYSLAFSVDSIPDYCRLEIALDAREMAGRAHLDFTASFGETTVNSSARFSPDKQWAQIDRIYVLKRSTIGVTGKSSQVDDIIAMVARRVLLTRTPEVFQFDFAIEKKVDLGEFETEERVESQVEHYLIFEFRQPLSMRIFDVDVRLTAEVAMPDLPSLALEDRNIGAQAEVIKGIESWIGAGVVVANNFTEIPTAERTVQRWNWKHAAMGSVEVVICVFNAVDETLACLSSLVGSTTVPHTVRIINDGSGEDTRQRILQFIADKPWMQLYDNPENIGYTASANRGIMESSSDWTILLNSDTIVSSGWIEGLLEAAASDPAVAFVGPVSNAATYQSVPELYDGSGKWAVNGLPDNWTVDQFGALVASSAERSFPDAPLLNGFCTLIKRSAFVALGGLNVAAFPAGYGEENDLCIRATKSGYRLVIADHVFVYHSKSASFGSARRLELAKAGDKALRAMHSDIDFSALGRRFAEIPALAQLRASTRRAYGPSSSREGAKSKGKK